AAPPYRSGRARGRSLHGPEATTGRHSFFFQAEDGIRDRNVTGVQTCALPIYKYESEVIGKKEAEQWLEKSEVKRITQIVRSGQVVEVTGDLLLVGDVNPGGQVKATGSIYVLGHLNGIAHAGVYGDEKAVIAASYMNPTQLRIAKYISRAPDYEASGVYMECGYLDKS